MTLIDKIVHYIILLLIWTVFKWVYLSFKVDKNVTVCCIISILVLLTHIFNQTSPVHPVSGYINSQLLQNILRGGRPSRQKSAVMACWSVRSTNILIFKYQNKMALKYYLYLYSCHFPSTNVFGYSFVDFWTTEFIRIFVCKFLKT